jgi:cell wall-associated NlpC family hydrolase
MAKEIYNVIVHTADIYERDDDNAAISNNDSQLLYGESFEVKSETADFYYGKSLIDNYKGFVKKAFLQKANADPSHFINVLSSHIYPEPSFKTRPLMPLSFLSRLHLDAKNEKNGFVKLEHGGWVFKEHIKPIREMKNETPLNTALMFLGTPYLYGGRSSQGLDCSALIQLAMLRNGIKDCERDSSDQANTIGTEIPEKDITKGDLVFFKGHVAIMLDDKNVLNATARKMATVKEPLQKLIKEYGNITAARRP